MIRVESQSHFGQTNPESGRSAESIDSVTRAAFQKVQNLWSKYSFFVPQDYDFKTSGYCEVNFPGGNMSLSERKAKFISSSYEDWVSRGLKVIGWEADVHDSQSGRYNFYFSKAGQLIGFYSSQKQPAEKDYDRKKAYINNDELPRLFTRASFRGYRLYSIFYDVPNGTLFLDPRGEVDSIWPQWTKKGMDSIEGIDHVEYLGEDNYPAIEEDWKWYLERIKERKLVLNPRTGNYVHQTERQAVANLKRSRIWIYYHTPQGFHFYKTGGEPGFVSEIG